MGPVEAITTCLRKSFRFSGPASRSEFWWFALLTIGGAFACFWFVEIMLPRRIAQFQNPAAATMLSFIGLTLLPFTSAACRRLHDAGRTGLWIAVPYCVLLLGIGLSLYDSEIANKGGDYAGLGGAIVGYGGFLLTAPFLLLAFALPSKSGPNRYGPNPREVTP